MLLSNEALRDEYAGVKRRLVEREFDGKKPESEYCKNKTGILLKILKEAGWGDDDLEEVRRANE